MTLNLYTYVGNNPLIRVDPTGHMWGLEQLQWAVNYTQDAIVKATKAAIAALSGPWYDAYNAAYGYDFITGKKLSVTERTINVASAALFFIPDVGLALGKGAAKEMTVLNIGSGLNRIIGALNIDLRAVKGVDLVADVTKTLPFEKGSVDALISINPYGFKPLNDATFEVLTPGGSFTIVGQLQNKYFKEVYNATEAALKEMGYEIVYRGVADDAFKYGTKTTNGHDIDPSTLYQITLTKK